MNELFDKLIIRVILTLFIGLVIFVYKMAHTFLYPSSTKVMFRQFLPSKNSADTLHLFSRIIGIGIIFSQLHFRLSDGLLQGILDFLIVSTVAFVIYLASIYILESIVLYNFEYHEEVVKKNNLAYSVISFAQAISLAYLLRSIINVAGDSRIIILFLWLFAISLLGFATKSFSLFSKLSFNSLLIRKNLTVSLSYMGFILGWSVIIASSLNNDIKNLQWYVIQVFLKVLLSIIIFPIFMKCLILIFNIGDDFDPDTGLDTPAPGYGIYEGIMFFTSCLLTSIIIGHIGFGTFYPV